MNLLPLNRLGAHETSPGVVQFGIFLPNIAPGTVQSVSVAVIAEADEIRTGISAVTIPLAHSIDPTYGDYWSGTVTLAAYAPAGGSAWGSATTHLYWYQVTLTSGVVIDRLIDPFAREFGFEDLSAITIGFQPRPWAASEAAWETPALSDLMVYELELNEFGGSLLGSQGMLPHVQTLGFNAIEVMPVTNAGEVITWGYSAVGFFGVDQRFGNRINFQAFVEAAHACQLAVILDMVYGHTDPRFLYNRLYAEAGLLNPVMNPNGQYGPTPLFATSFVQDFFYTVNQFWLQVYHVDGIRYDNVDPAVAGFWDGQGGGYYPALTEATYRYVAAQVPTSPDWQRFFRGGELRLVQCAECLGQPTAVLNQTFSNCTWQDNTLSAAYAAAAGQPLYNLGIQSGLVGYPSSATNSNVTLSKSAMQYVETHDHKRFVCTYGTHSMDALNSQVLWEGNRTDAPGYVGRWFAVQPYLFVVFLAKGIPFLWQGQEIGENYYVPDDVFESGRVRLFRPVRWGDYANDVPGTSLCELVKNLAALRKRAVQFRQGDHCFVNDYANYQSKGLLVFTRTLGTKTSLVALNFTNSVQSATFTFSTSGSYTEEIDGAPSLVVTAGTPCTFSVPSNYGRVWTSP